MARAGEASRVLFKAAVNDEFEFLDAEGEWVHVQISGVSRGYIRRSALELPQVIAERLGATAKAPADGVLVIFDSADGGIAGATLASIRQLAKGEISEEAFWKQSYLDPPETSRSNR